MVLNLLSLIRRRLKALRHNINQHLRRWTKPDNQSLALNAILDLTRSKSELVLENALLRQQLIVLQRHVKRPALTWRDRALFVLIASKLPSWETALMIVQPDTLLRWHRDLFRRVWRRKSRRKGKKGREPLAEDIARLIKNMAKDNRTWGAE
jgi:putative transposase